MNKQALSLAVFIAGAYPAASSALGLGDIESNSHLNQPLRATIDLLSAAPADASQIQVRLAPPDVFNRVGVARPDFLSNLRFQPTVQGGKPVILVTSDSPIQEPFVNFLLEVSWPQGQLLKEYTVMLDPPVLMQPGNTVAGEAAVRAEPKAAGNVRRPARQQQAAPSRPAAQQQPQQAPAAAPRNRTYRVKSGDTLFRVASRLQQSGVSNDQMMMALFRANPGAFIDNNINNLRTGAVLKAPSDVGSVSRAEARRQIRQQNAEWREFRKSLAGRTVPQQPTGTKQAASKPAGKPADTARTTAKGSDKARLEVLGAKTGDGATAKDAAVAAGSAKLAELEKQLALANESLATRQGENNELKSRVTDLESMLSKKNRLLALRDSQLAELQKKLTDNGIQAPVMADTPDGQPSANGQPANADTKIDVKAGAPDQGKDIQTHMANVAGQGSDTVVRNGQQPATPVPPGNAAQLEPPAPTGTAAAPPAAPVTPPPATATTQPAPATPAPAAGSSLVPLKPPAPVTAPKPVEKPAVVPVTPDLGSKPDSKTPAVFADQAGGSDDLMALLTSPLAMKIGAGSLALLALLWLLGRRRKPENPKERFANLDDDIPPADDDALDLGSLETELQKAEQRGDKRGYDNAAAQSHNDPFGLQAEGEWDDDDTTISGFASPAAKPGVEDDGVDDLITEANVYIAYGLYQQAESELKKGIERQPDNLEYRHKLLECYFVANNREAFDAQAQQFAGMGGSSKDTLWKAVAEWGRKISPDNRLYQGDAPPASSVAATVAAALGGVGVAAAGAALASSDDEDDVPAPRAEAAPVLVPAASAAAGHDNALPQLDDDFSDLDLGDLDFDDIDLDKLLQDDGSLDFPTETEVKPTAIPAPEPRHVEASPQPAQMDDEPFELDALDDDLDLDLDFNLDDEQPAPVRAAEPVADKRSNGIAHDDDDNLLDFSLDDDEQENTPEVPVAAPALAAAASATNLNLHLDNNTGINRILPKDTFYAPISSEDKEWLGDIDDALSFLDFPDEEIDLHEAHISTKLDLARAYLDMGDIEGARSTLEEVMVEGNDDQRREAEVLLHQTG